MQTSWKKKLICLHFEFSIVSHVAPDYPPKIMEYMYNHWPYSLTMNFHKMYIIMTYTFSDYFTYSIVTCHHFLSIPKGSILRLHFCRLPVWTDRKEKKSPKPTYSITFVLSFRQSWKSPHGVLLKYTLTLSLEKMELSSWDETNFLWGGDRIL